MAAEDTGVNVLKHCRKLTKTLQEIQSGYRIQKEKVDQNLHDCLVKNSVIFSNLIS